MKIDMQIDDALKNRNDLIQIMKAAADFLASRDADADSKAEASWRLGSGPNGGTWIALNLRDEDYSRSQQFTPNQLVPAEIRELRLLELWYDVARQRTRRQYVRVNELISQMED